LRFVGFVGHLPLHIRHGHYSNAVNVYAGLAIPPFMSKG
jgi:hypothetical protein